MEKVAVVAPNSDGTLPTADKPKDAAKPDAPKPGEVAGGGTPAPEVKPEKYDVKGAGEFGYKTNDKGEKVKDEKSKNGQGYVSGEGVGYGDRKSDTHQPVDEKDPSKGTERKNEKVTIKDVTSIPEPELDKLESSKKAEVEGKYGTYAGYDVKSGTAKGGTTDIEPGAYKPGEGAEVKGPNAYYQKGAEAKAYAGIKGEKEGEYGKVEGKGEAYAKAYAGMSGKAGIDQDGASAKGAIGAGVKAGVEADADYKTPGMKVDGVTKPLDAGIGVHGEASVSVKAGASGGAYLTKDKVGVEGKIGAGAVAEAKANVHGNIGPVGAKGEIGVLAGAGIGAEGGIVYENGKLRIGARAYAALGYGVSAGVEVEIDIKQSYELAVAIMKAAKQKGIEGAQAAFKMADADNDGKLSLNDAATHGANAMESGAKSIDKGADSVIKGMDHDGDGKFGVGDIKGHAGDAYDAVANKAGELKDKAGALKDKAVDKGKELLAKGKSAADMDGDGQLGINDLQVGYDKGKAYAGEKINQAGEAITKTKDEAVAWGSQKLDDAQKGAEKLGQDLHKLADRDGDNKLGMGDIKQGASDAVEKGKEIGNAALDMGGKAIDKGKELGGKAIDKGMELGGKAIDYGKEKAGQAVDYGKEKAGQAKDAVKKAADRDGDGKLSLNDAKEGVKQAAVVIDQTIDQTKAKLQAGYDTAKAKVEAAGKAVYDAADLNKDGVVDAKDAAVAKAKAEAAALWAKQQAQKKLEQAKAAALAAKAELERKATAAKEAVQKAVDRDGDGAFGVNDIKVGAGEAYDATKAKAIAAKNTVVTGAKNAYDSAAAGLSKAGDTLASGYNKASETLSGTASKLNSYFNPWAD